MTLFHARLNFGESLLQGCFLPYFGESVKGSMEDHVVFVNLASCAETHSCFLPGWCEKHKKYNFSINPLNLNFIFCVTSSILPTEKQIRKFLKNLSRISYIPFPLLLTQQKNWGTNKREIFVLDMEYGFYKTSFGAEAS